MLYLAGIGRDLTGGSIGDTYLTSTISFFDEIYFMTSTPTIFADLLFNLEVNLLRLNAPFV